VSIWDKTDCTLSQCTPGLVAKFIEIKKIKHTEKCLKFTGRLEFCSWEQFCSVEFTQWLSFRLPSLCCVMVANLLASQRSRPITSYQTNYQLFIKVDWLENLLKHSLLSTMLSWKL